MEDSAEHLTQPSVEEQQGYYFGLPSESKLVARSSSNPWSPQKDHLPIGKQLYPVGPHIIADQWNISTGPLDADIRQALKDVKWTAIDILRIGYTRIPLSNETPERPVTFVISVEPDSTSWSQGHKVVMECRQILQRHGIDDVHVEMKESRVFWSASTAPTLGSFAASTVSPINPHESVRAEYLGESIAPFDEPNCGGTKCVYLRRKDTGGILALTCRHVLFDDAMLDEEYRHNSLDPRPVIQPSNACLQVVKTCLTQGFVQAMFAIRLLSLSDPSDAERQMIETNENIKSSNKELMQHLKTLDDPASRIIGHVLFSPKLGVCNTESGAKRMRDWALIELHPEKHQSPLIKLENRVIVRPHGAERITRSAREFRDTQVRLDYSEGTQTVRLQGTIPEAEMRSSTTSTTGDTAASMVAKRGATRCLTIGLGNNVRSVIRHPYNDDMISDEWCIIGEEKRLTTGQSPFSQSGDSGSCVWDFRCRIGGMITGGGGNFDTGCLDVTYATPMEWLLDDIRNHGFDVELV